MSSAERSASEAFVHRRFFWMLLALLAGCAFVYLIGNQRVSLWDRDEPRYAQTSRQMLQSGDWVLPHFLNEVRNAKPIGIYWCQAASMALFGDTAAAARFPSALAMLCVIALLATTLRAEVGPVRGFWAAFIFATSLLTIILAKMCMTDAVLLLPITVEQICLYLMWRRRARWPIVICFAAAVGVAGLIKGPVALAYPAATLAALLLIGLVPAYGQRAAPKRSWRPWRPRAVAKIIVAVAVVVAIVGPWVYLVARRDPAFIGSSLWKNVFLRTVQPAEQHSGPPGYYLLTIWVCEFPWSLILPAALFTAWRHRRVPALRFALAATVGPWLMFECIRTKLPHYLLPIYPALALMTADALVRASRRTINDLTNPAFKGVLVIWEILVAALGLTPFLASHWFPLTQWNYATMALLSVAILHLAIGTGRTLGPGRVRLAVARMGVRMLICCAIAWGLVLPSLDFLQIPRRVAAALAAAGATPHDRTVMIDYKEPSLAFYQGGTIEEIPDKMYLPDRSRSNWPRWIVTDRRVWELMPPRIQHALRIVAVVHGLNYADGMRIEDVLVIKNPSATMSKGHG
jgi:4-amino-4-deoxy-L-arabinose transferase-like glycosyltransferase